jgi:hypothetical protein
MSKEEEIQLQPEAALLEGELQQEAQAVSPPPNNKETVASTSSALQTFLRTYNTFISENQNVCIDLDKVMTDMNVQIKGLPPPVKYHNRLYSSPARYEQLWRKGQSIDKPSVQQTASKLKKMNDVKLYETIVNIEKLYAKLNMEYNTEINRSVGLGLIHKQP